MHALLTLLPAEVLTAVRCQYGNIQTAELQSVVLSHLAGLQADSSDVLLLRRQVRG